MLHRVSGGDAWTAEACGLGDVIALREVGVGLPVEELYRRTAVAPAEVSD